MTPKPMKTKLRAKRPRPGKINRLHASIEADLLSIVDEAAGESRWSRPRKQRISLRVDTEVVDWFKSKGPGYQTRMNGILRRVMEEAKGRKGKK